MRVLSAEHAALSTKMSIARQLRDARKRLGLKQDAVAAQCGWKAVSKISAFEHGHKVPELDDGPLLEEALKLPKHSLTTLICKHQVQQSVAYVQDRAEEHGLEFEVYLKFQK